MTHWIRKQIDSGFADLKGLRVNATIPLKDQFINEALAGFLQSSGSSSPVTGPSGPDMRPLLRLVKRAQVHSTDGTVVVDVEISV
jgi:hypothetical protein